MQVYLINFIVECSFCMFHKASSSVRDQYRVAIEEPEPLSITLQYNSAAITIKSVRGTLLALSVVVCTYFVPLALILFSENLVRIFRRKWQNCFHT